MGSTKLWKGIDKMYNNDYFRGLENGYKEGCKAALNKINIPLKELDRLLWNDKEWKSKGDQYIDKYNQIMKLLPEDSRHLLLELELIEIEQSNRSLKIFYDYINAIGEDGVSNDR